MIFLITVWQHDSYIIQKQKDPSKAHQVKLDVIVRALKWLEMDMDVDEVTINLFLLFSPQSIYLFQSFHGLSHKEVGISYQFMPLFAGRVYHGHTNI